MNLVSFCFSQRAILLSGGILLLYLWQWQNDYNGMPPLLLACWNLCLEINKEIEEHIGHAYIAYSLKI